MAQVTGSDPGLDIGDVAVVTGAALGIGLALCRRLAKSGVSVVMADLPGGDLDAAIDLVRSDCRDAGTKVLGVATDVARTGQIDSLRDATLDHFGCVDLLINNAVTRVGRGFGSAIEDWRLAMEVNLWGPVNCVRAFLPTMLASANRARIVNVGSKQGITNPPGHPIYNMTKSALKTYTEALAHDLRHNSANQAVGRRVTAHLLVPGWTTTGKAAHQPGAWLPDQVVDHLMTGLSGDSFYIICPDGEVTTAMDKQRILWAAQDMTEGRPALSRWHPDYADEARKYCG